LLGGCWRGLRGSLDSLWRALAPVIGGFLGAGWLRGELAAQSRAGCDPVGACGLLLWLRSRVVGARVCVAGPAARLDLDCDVYAAPEGGLGRALEAGVRLLYVAGDMDASLRLLAMAPYAAEAYLAHLHGDNWARTPPRGAPLLYTSQAPASNPCILGPAGFTDGDRAAVVAMLLGAEEVVLDGYWGEADSGHKDWRGAGKPWKLAAAREALRAAAAALGYREEPGSEEPRRYLRLPRRSPGQG